MAEKKSTIEDYDYQYQPGFIDDSITNQTTTRSTTGRINEYDTYVSRNVKEDTLNWNTVAKTITGQLNAVAEDRVARKKNIEDQTANAVSILEDIDNYTEVNANNAVIEMAQAVKENLLIANRLLKQGVMKPVDYLKIVEGAKSQMKTWGVAAKNFEKDYVSHLDRQKSDLAGADETFLAESYYAFGNMKNVKSFVSPSGKAYLVRLDDKGKMPDFNKEPGKFLPVQSMNKRNQFQSNEIDFNIPEQVALQTDKMGTFLRETLGESVTFEDGVIRITREGLKELNENPELKATFKKYKQSVKDRILGSENGQSLANVLVGSAGSEYKYATSKQDYIQKYGKDADLTKMIIIDATNIPPTYTFGEDDSQKAAMTEAGEKMIEEEIDMQIGSTYKEDVKESPRTDDQRNPGGNTEADDAAYVKELNTIMTGNLVDAEAALKRRIDTKNQNIEFEDDKIVSFEITDDQIILRRQKGDPLTIDRTGDSGLEDDLETDIDESISTLSTLDDIVSISDVLSPTDLSKGSIEEIIEREKIILGKRRKGGVGSKVGKSEIPAIGNNAKAPNGLTILESIAGGIGSKGTVSATDSNEKIQGVIEGIISEHMPAELAKEISSNPGLYGPTTIEQVPNMDQMKVTIAGKSIVFNTKRLTSLAGIANKITEVMNEARTVANKNRTNTKLKKSNKNLSFPEWKKVPGNENKKSTDWKKATGRN